MNAYIKKLETAREFLNHHVLEQEVAVDEVVYALYEKAKQPMKGAPLEVFLFCGAPSSGKRYLAQKLAEQDEHFSDFITIDMGRFIDPANGDELYGVGLDENGSIRRYGELYLIMQEKPNCVLVFDSIDKADPNVQATLAKMIAEPENFDISFAEAVVIFTTNYGEELYKKGSYLEHFTADPIKGRDWMVELLATKELQPGRDLMAAELLTLFLHHHVVPFGELSIKILAEIGLKAVRSLLPVFGKKIGAEVKMSSSKSLAALLTLSSLPYINAREIKNKMPELLFFEISRLLKKAGHTPKTLNIEIGDGAKKFYDRYKDAINAHVSDAHSQLKSVHLTWKDSWEGSHATVTLVGAEFRKNLNQKMHDYGQKPRIRVSEIGFADIAGQKQVKAALKEVINLLGKQEMLEKFHTTLPRGMVLYGPDGVGKTTLAEAFCKEADMPYIIISTSELFNQNYVKHVYHIAKMQAPMAVILERIDMQGVVEGMVTTVPADPIVEMIESLAAHDMVFTIATANSDISGELTKSGRVDMRIEVPELDKEARKFYVQQILKKPNDGKIDPERVVRYISGMSRDELERLDREVAINAVKKGLSVISEELIIEQINIIKYGQKLDSKKVKNFDEELKMTAYHEAGHAVLSNILLPDIRIEQVTITPRSDALGFVSYSSEDYESNVTKEELFSNVCVLLAGRIAKLKQFGEVKGLDSGAMNDLERATAQVYMAITMLGMDEELGMISLGALDESIIPIFGRKIEERIQDWITRAKTKTELLVAQHWDKIEALAKKLIEHEVVEGEELESIIGNA